jgi:hypothetical protein
MKLNDHEIKGNELLVLLYLAFRHSRKEDLSWPTWKEIMSSCSMGKTSVSMSINKLERLKVIERVLRPSGLAYRLTEGAQLELFPAGLEVQNPNPPGSESEPPEVQNPNPEVQNPNPPYIVENKGEHKKRTSEAPSEPLPENLQNPDFVEAWDRWRTFRKEIKKKLTPSTEKAQLKKLSGWGAADAIESIEQSIEHGWQGLFEPKVNSNGTSTSGNLKGIRKLARNNEGLNLSRDQYRDLE